jgi:hypothetical protein
MSERFFQFRSAQNKVVYIPLSRLLRIETNPRGASVVFFFEGDYSVNVETTTGQEAEVARRCGGLIPSPDDEIVIAPGDPGIAAVNM